MARLKEKCPPELQGLMEHNTLKFHCAFWGRGGCTIGDTKLEFFLRFFPKNE